MRPRPRPLQPTSRASRAGCPRSPDAHVRRRRHEMLSVDQLVPLPIVGKLQEVVVGELHVRVGHAHELVPGHALILPLVSATAVPRSHHPRHAVFVGDRASRPQDSELNQQPTRTNCDALAIRTEHPAGAAPARWRPRRSSPPGRRRRTNCGSCQKAVPLRWAEGRIIRADGLMGAVTRRVPSRSPKADASPRRCRRSRDCVADDWRDARPGDCEWYRPSSRRPAGSSECVFLVTSVPAGLKRRAESCFCSGASRAARRRSSPCGATSGECVPWASHADHRSGFIVQRTSPRLACRSSRGCACL